MKLKTLLASLVLASSISAGATNLVMVMESDQGIRLVVDSDSFVAVPADDKTPLIAARFSYVKDGEFTTPFAYVTEVASCKTRNGPLYYRVQEGNTWITKQKYFWSANGNKMYDAAGNALCDILEVRIQESSPSKHKSKSEI